RTPRAFDAGQRAACPRRRGALLLSRSSARVRANRGRLLPRTVTAPFTDTRRGTLAAVLDALVPDDEHGPGALSAGVLGFVEDALDDALADLRPAYADGLDTLDALARSAHGCPFAALDAARRDP